ncbi:MAG TPA: threonine/serine dehydratase [Micromonosporaceae bacterium]
MRLVTIDDIRAATENIRGVAVRTPLLPCLWAPGLWLKPESLQPIGAFKVRGAQHAIASLPADRRAAGVITHSSGNHAQAVAYAAATFGVPCVVVMPDVASAVKIEATRALGAEIVLVPPAERLSRMTELAHERGLAPIPPFDDPAVIAGQGTVGLEIVDDLPDVRTVLVPVGGGGLASGVATAVKALVPGATVIGVEPEDAADTEASLRAGHLVDWPIERAYRTVADGLRTQPSELTFAHLAQRLDGMLTVSDSEIVDAVRVLARSARLVVEPSGAVATAAYLYRRDALPDGKTVAVITGGNVDPAFFAKLLAE